MATTETPDGAVWVHCTPLLITKGLTLCSALPRRACQCGAGSHDHLVDVFWAQQNRVPPIDQDERAASSHDEGSQ